MISWIKSYNTGEVKARYRKIWLQKFDSINIQRGAATTSCNNAAAAAKSLQSCPTLCDPIDGSARCFQKVSNHLLTYQI